MRAKRSSQSQLDLFVFAKLFLCKRAWAKLACHDICSIKLQAAAGNAHHCPQFAFLNGSPCPSFQDCRPRDFVAAMPHANEAEGTAKRCLR